MMKPLRIATLVLFASVLTFSVGIALSSYASAETVKEEGISKTEQTRKVALAQEFFKIRPVSLVAIKAIENLASLKPQQERALFMQQMRLHMDFAQLESEMIESLIKTYSAEEIEAMVAYYGSDVGKSISEKQSVFEQDVSGIVQKMLDKAFVEARYGKNGLQSRP